MPDPDRMAGRACGVPRTRSSTSSRRGQSMARVHLTAVLPTCSHASVCACEPAVSRSRTQVRRARIGSTGRRTQHSEARAGAVRRAPRPGIVTARRRGGRATRRRGPAGGRDGIGAWGGRRGPRCGGRGLRCSRPGARDSGSGADDLPKKRAPEPENRGDAPEKRGPPPQGRAPEPESHDAAPTRSLLGRPRCPHLPTPLRPCPRRFGVHRLPAASAHDPLAPTSNRLASTNSPLALPRTVCQEPAVV